MADFRLRNITTALSKIFSNTKPGEFVARNSIENALSATRRDLAAAAPLNPTVLSDKGVDKGTIFSAEKGISKDYHRYLERESMRHMRYTLYERMDADLLASALDVYANECTQKNTEGKIVGVYSQSKYIQDELTTMLSESGINNFKSWMVIRNMCKYGDHFAALQLDSIRGVTGIKDLDPISVFRIEKDGQFEGYIQDLDVLKSNVQNANVTSATMNPYVNLNTLSLPYMTGDSSVVTRNADEDSLIGFLKYEMAHFRLRGKGTFLPYGTSVLDSSVDIWKKLDLLFDSLIIYRLNRAPSRLVFYVDVGTNQGNDVENLVRRQINAINKKEYFGPNGKLNERYQLLDMNANIFIPQQKGGQSKVDMLAGASNVGEIEDVAFLNNRLFSALKVPKSFLGYEGDTSGKGMLSQQNVTFGKAVQNIQEDFLNTIKDVCLIHLAIRGVSDLDELKSFDLVMTRPSYIEEKARLEIESESMNLATSYQAFGANREWVAKHILRKTDGEIQEMFKQDTTPAAQAEQGGGMGGLGAGALGGGLGIGNELGGTELPPPGPGAEQLGGAPLPPPPPAAGPTPIPAEVGPAGANIPLTQSRRYDNNLLIESTNVILPVSSLNSEFRKLKRLIKENGILGEDTFGTPVSLTEETKKQLTEPEQIFEN